MRFTALFMAAIFALSTALVGCERKDVKEEMDEDKEKVIDKEEELDPISPDPEEADEELPGVPDEMPDRPGGPED